MKISMWSNGPGAYMVAEAFLEQEQETLREVVIHSEIQAHAYLEHCLTTPLTSTTAWDAVVDNEGYSS